MHRSSKFVYRLKVCDFNSSIQEHNMHLLMHPVPPTEFTVEETDNQRQWRQLSCQRIHDEMLAMHESLKARIEYAKHAAGAPAQARLQARQDEQDRPVHKEDPFAGTEPGASPIMDAEVPLADLTSLPSTDAGHDFESLWGDAGDLCRCVSAVNEAAGIPKFDDNTDMEAWTETCAEFLKQTTPSEKTRNDFREEITPLLKIIKRTARFSALYDYTLRQRQRAFNEGLYSAMNQSAGAQAAGAQAAAQAAGEPSGT